MFEILFTFIFLKHMAFDLNSMLVDKSSLSLIPGVVDGYTFDANTERDSIQSMHIRDASITNAKIGTAAIGTANIGTLSFNEISGGTAVLGGTLNGDGVLSVRNSGGTEVVRADKDGIVVTANNGTTIIDGTGLVSTANFISNYVAQNSDQTTTSTSYGDLSGLSTTFTTTRTANILIGATLAAYIENTDPGNIGIVNFKFVLDGTDIGPVLLLSGPGLGLPSQRQTISASFLQASVSSGSHTLKIQWKMNSGSDLAKVYGGGGSTNQNLLYYVILGN